MSRRKVLVHSWLEALDVVDGKSYVLDGIHGHLRVEKIHGMTELMHYPSALGKKSDPYLRLREKYRDDWATRLGEERAVRVVEKFVKFAPRR